MMFESSCFLYLDVSFDLCYHDTQIPVFTMQNYINLCTEMWIEGMYLSLVNSLLLSLLKRSPSCIPAHKGRRVRGCLVVCWLLVCHIMDMALPSFNVEHFP